MFWLLEEISLVFLVSGWWGRRVSIGESKLCHSITPTKVPNTKLPVSWSCNWTVEIPTVFVDQTVNLPASIKIRFPLFSRESFARHRRKVGWTIWQGNRRYHQQDRNQPKIFHWVKSKHLWVSPPSEMTMRPNCKRLLTKVEKIQADWEEARAMVQLWFVWTARRTVAEGRRSKPREDGREEHKESSTLAVETLDILLSIMSGRARSQQMSMICPHFNDN